MRTDPKEKRDSNDSEEETEGRGQVRRMLQMLDVSVASFQPSSNDVSDFQGLRQADPNSFHINHDHP